VEHFYREAVATFSPTLPRFAATLGRGGVNCNLYRESGCGLLATMANRFAVELLNGWTQRSREARQL